MVGDNHDGESLEGFVKDITQCPVCGGGERYFEGIINDLKGKGLVGKEVACFDFQLQEGMAIPEQKAAGLPLGSEIPVFKRLWDTCSSCGIVYSTHLERGLVNKSLNLAQPTLDLNRAQRWRIGRIGEDYHPLKG